mmetsp:Transcript_66867/g.157562  ORF Transcript_66867/g.157562 Transcript_66867/m.157562 type:complete len:227 (-) Transcript_66867:882-1562(-)
MTSSALTSPVPSSSKVRKTIASSFWSSWMAFWYLKSDEEICRMRILISRVGSHRTYRNTATPNPTSQPNVMMRVTIMIKVVPTLAAPIMKRTANTTTPTSGKVTRDMSSTKRAECVETVARMACAKTFSRTLANMMTVTQNMVTSIHSSEEVSFGIMEYASVLKTCRERKEMNPVATRGITMSMGIKKPAKGMKRRAVKGQKKRRIKMVIRRDTVTLVQTEVVTSD